MSTKNEQIVKSLRGGDVINVQEKCGDEGCNNHTLYSVVLRTNEQGGIYFSQFSDEPTGTPSKYNPYRWDESKGALVDCDGDTPKLYNLAIQVERGAGESIVVDYDKIPRSSGKFNPPDDAKLKKFCGSNMSDIIKGIIRNGETGSPLEQTATLMQQIGIEPSEEQLIALTFILQEARREVADNSSPRIIGIGMEINIPVDESGYESTPSRKPH